MGAPLADDRLVLALAPGDLEARARSAARLRFLRLEADLRSASVAREVWRGFLEALALRNSFAV